MKILIFNWRDITHPWAGGAEKYVHEIGKRLAKKHEVTLFCGSYPGCAKEEVLDGIGVIRAGGRFTTYIHATLSYLKKLRKREYDVIVDSINGVPFFTPLYSRKPVVAIIHHIVGWKIFKRELPLPLASVGYLSEKLIPYIYRNCKFVTVSESTKEELKRFGIQGNVSVIPNGIDVGFHLGKKAEKPRIVYFGRIKNYKRIDHILKAYSIVKQRIPDAELVIAGRGEFDHLQDYAISLKIDESVMFMGEVDEEAKVEILSSAWVYVIASTKEGWGISVIEANACGTPAIAYDVPGLRDSVKNGYNGLLVEDSDVKALANAIVNVLEDDKLREELSKNAIEWAKQFNWDRSAEEFERVLKSLSR
jgi:glycosyltransferase involved in cell wall biosynthesis